MNEVLIYILPTDKALFLYLFRKNNRFPSIFYKSRILQKADNSAKFSRRVELCYISWKLEN